MKKYAFTETLPSSRIHYNVKPGMISFDVIFDSNISINPENIESVFIEESGKSFINISIITKD